MGKLSKRQQKRIHYFLRQKEERRAKQRMIHDPQAPKFIERHLPYLRRLARNLDQLLIVSSFVSPPLKTGLIDRFLVLTEIEDIEGLVCLNKTDLVPKEEARGIAAIYQSIGYQTLLTSAKNGTGVKELFELLKGKRTALAGHSGVGKSSLLNAIDPQLEISVQEVSESTGKGKHTTTQVKVYNLQENTEVIDLPGIKLVDFIDIHPHDARFYFREFEDYAEECKFRDCQHITEHDCAVKQAVEEGLIYKQRYESYLTFVESLSIR